MTNAQERKTKRETARIKGNASDYQLVEIYYDKAGIRSDLSNIPLNNVHKVFNPKTKTLLYIGKGELKKYFNMTPSGLKFDRSKLEEQRQKDIDALTKTVK